MSLLSQLFNRGVFGAKCKTCLSLSISRIKLLQNKRDMQLKHMRREIAQFLQAGQEPIARIRVEHIIREQNIWAAFEILELFCEFVLARVPIIENQKECPTELLEAIASIIFAAPRCSDVPDLLQLKNLFTAKYGKEFISAVSELRPDSGVNRAIIEKLTVSAPSAELRLKTLKDIAKEYDLEWDSSSTEAELNKRHEDLLAGSKQICNEVVPSQAPIRQLPESNVSAYSKQDYQGLQLPSPGSNILSYASKESEPKTGKNGGGKVTDVRSESRSQLPDVLERARAAIANAERASAAARAASELVNGQFGSVKLKDGTSS